MRLWVLGFLSVLLLSGCAFKSKQPASEALGIVTFVKYNTKKTLTDTFSYSYSYKQNMEIFLDDGRLFTVINYKSANPFRIGDRVLLRYINRDAIEVIFLDELISSEDIFDAY